jgi:hypothetical protein
MILDKEKHEKEKKKPQKKIDERLDSNWSVDDNNLFVRC